MKLENAQFPVMIGVDTACSCGFAEVWSSLSYAGFMVSIVSRPSQFHADPLLFPTHVSGKGEGAPTKVRDSAAFHGSLRSSSVLHCACQEHAALDESSIRYCGMSTSNCPIVREASSSTDLMGVWTLNLSQLSLRKIREFFFDPSVFQK